MSCPRTQYNVPGPRTQTARSGECTTKTLPRNPACFLTSSTHDIQQKGIIAHSLLIFFEAKLESFVNRQRWLDAPHICHVITSFCIPLPFCFALFLNNTIELNFTFHLLSSSVYGRFVTYGLKTQSSRIEINIVCRRSVVDVHFHFYSMSVKFYCVLQIRYRGLRFSISPKIDKDKK